ncbi:multidrug effflux MFS transporter [Spirilliplanes yamanashiensis]|uniref:Bcr/CflA family drug resistance efflux transporter n=1 Tax=Spirilliplanes yamanashiensis TaxID=42233 RepID=A0A8J4DMU2_9ACTN|nr:multidrug effflux MFS transporter [Spirilliplanes yamanashiensis]MDP9815192.1 DHA1 family bicyclomycin/chloramphenicol resistance-like MFS transporter [Spirilliplanes yamanashiensis]GIJ06540.1 Bcr/CflA family drug resistance efflux transporter [Spirilliplanes yamanashiensis]
MTTLADKPAVAEGSPGDSWTTAQRLRLVLVLGALIAIGPLTIDMYLPALPTITEQLRATPAAVQLTLTGTLAGLALGQLFIGPMSDRFGRRRPLLAGVAVHVVASILCAIAPNLAVLGTLRVLQGLGAAAAAVIAMAIVRDLFTGLAAAKLLSRLMLVMGAAPVLAPTLGGEVLRFTDWRGVFAALAVLGVLIGLLALAWLPETLPQARRRTDGVVGTLRTYASLLRDRRFVGLILVAGLAMAGLFAYVSGSSFVFQEQYGMDEQRFALTFGAGAVGLIAATQLNVRLLRRFTPGQILGYALAGGTVMAFVLVFFAATGVGGLPPLLISLWSVLAFAGLAFPNAPALALSRHGEAAGTASALLGAVQFGVGALAAPLVGALGTGAISMASVIALGMTLAVVVLLVVVRPSGLAPEPAVAVTGA